MKDDRRLAKGRRWFEYHCYEGEDSSDAELWHHTHQQVEVLGKLDTDCGEPKQYQVKFSDGLEYDVFEDELVTDPSQFSRPDYIKKEE